MNWLHEASCLDLDSRLAMNISWCEWSCGNTLLLITETEERCLSQALRYFSGAFDWWGL